MCGLFGVIPTNDERIKQAVALRHLAHANHSRGNKSYGLWSSDSVIVKKPESIRSPQGKFDLEGMVKKLDSGLWVMGHTRQPTHGPVNGDNAHPFLASDGSFAVAHNGTIQVEGYTDKDHPVDSGRLAIAMQQHGFEQAMALTTGACGLIVSTKDDVLLYRNSQILHFAMFPWGVAVSSDDDDLHSLAYILGTTDYELYYPEEGKFYSAITHEYILTAPCKERPPYKYTPKPYIPSEEDYVFTGWSSAERTKEPTVQPLKPLTTGPQGATRGQYIWNIMKSISRQTSLYQYLSRLSLADKIDVAEYWRTTFTPDRKSEWTSDWDGDPINFEYDGALIADLLWDSHDKIFWLIRSGEVCEFLKAFPKHRKPSPCASGYTPRGFLPAVLDAMAVSGIIEEDGTGHFVHPPVETIDEPEAITVEILD